MAQTGRSKDSLCVVLDALATKSGPVELANNFEFLSKYSLCPLYANTPRIDGVGSMRCHRLRVLDDEVEPALTSVRTGQQVASRHDT